MEIALGRAGRARAQSASALTFENILTESADQAPEDGTGIVEAVNQRLDEHIRDALEVYTDAGEREAMMDLLEGQAGPVRSRARDRQTDVRTGFLRRELAGVTDDWAASARLDPNEAPMIAIRATAAVHAVADNDDARVISAERIGDLVQATERKVLSAALSSLLEQDPDRVPALLADPDGPYRQVLPEDHLEEARAEAEVRVRAKAAETLSRLERAIDEGAAGTLELKQGAREGWVGEDAQARMQGKLDTRTAEARAGRERVLRVAGLVADGGSLDPSNLEDQEAADVYYESVVGPGLEALDPAERIGEAAGFAARMGVLPKGARRQIRGGLAAKEPVLRARAADAVVRLGEAAPELTQDFDSGLHTEAYLIAGLVDSGVDAARAVEMAGDALARNSAADRAERERRVTQENHAAENDRFLVERWDGIAEGPTVPTVDLHAVFSEMVRASFLRTGDLGAAQRNAFNDFWRQGFPLYPARDPDGNPFDPGLHLPPDLIDRPGLPDHGDAEPHLLPIRPGDGPSGENKPFPQKPRWVWENGVWRQVTPEDDSQSTGIPLADGGGGDGDGFEVVGAGESGSSEGVGGEGPGDGGGPAGVGEGDGGGPAGAGEGDGGQGGGEGGEGGGAKGRPAADGKGNDGKDSGQETTPDMKEPDGGASIEPGLRAPDAISTEKVDNADERFEEFYKRTEVLEGKRYTDDPTDFGGPTKLGITQKTLNAYHARKKGKAKDIPTDAKNLTPKDARTIYKEFYYDRYQVDKIVDPKLAGHIYDINVNPGPDRAARWAQQEINRVTGADEKVDGVMGSKTIQALNALSPEQRRQVMKGIVEKREAFYLHRVEEVPKLKKYLPGWIDRARSFLP